MSDLNTIEYRITDTQVSIRQTKNGWLTFSIGGPVAGLFLKDLFDGYNRLLIIEKAARQIAIQDVRTISGGYIVSAKAFDALAAALKETESK